MKKLEREFAAWLGVSDALATGFGRGALYLALEAAEVRGAQVLVPDFICAQVPGAVRRAGGEPVFYRVSRELRVSSTDFEAAFTPRTRAAVVAHYFGRALAEIAQLAEICRSRGVPLIEDAALALGATLSGRSCGTFGDFGVFSFTKSDWGYGGGVVVSNQPETLAKLRALREAHLRAFPRLSLRYGLLRRADFVANRPKWSPVAGRAGQWLERLTGPSDGNFYDAGRFDAALPDFAARRARQILASLPAATARRRRAWRQIWEAIAGEDVLHRRNESTEDAASFLLLRCPVGAAEHWRDEAARRGVTLRRCWPAYQDPAAEQESEEVRWLAEHLLLLEIHAELQSADARRIAAVVNGLATG